jgi:SAM-dependent methyltransferase
LASFLAHFTERDLSFFKADWFARQPRGRLLDLPAGRGDDSRRLVALGYDVVPADLFPETFDTRIGPKCRPADLAARLPFDEASFDYLLCSEAIEHLPDQLAMLRECARVLRPRGKLFVTTPNLLSLRARLAFLLTGNRAFRTWVDEVTSVWGYQDGRIYHGHAFLINYLQLRYLLWHSGLRVVEVVANRFSWTSIGLLPLAPFVWLASRWAMRKAKARNPRPGIYREIERDLFSPALLLSSNLFVVAERIPDAEREPPLVVEKHRRNLEQAVARAKASR